MSKTPRLLVEISKQQATLFLKGKAHKTYPVSTAARGTGGEMGSYQTPLGLMRVSEKFGEGMALGTVFDSREPTGQIWTSEKADSLGENLILTRILWLEGCEPQNILTKERYIYLHGTKNEDKLGTPTSQGCINLSNKDIVEIYDLLPVGAEIKVIP